MIRINKFRYAAYLVTGCFVLAMTTCGVSYAAASKSNSTSSPSSASPIIQSFNAGSDIYPGMLVYANPKSPGSVLPLMNTNMKKLLGVVVPINSAQLSLTPSNSSTQQVLVAESGRYDVLVSSEGGNIASGDDLSMSSLNGIAMKAGGSDQTSVGQAQSSFNGKTGIISEFKIKVSSGKEVTYAIGSIVADVHLGQNALYIQSTSGLPQFVVQAAYTIAKKPVSPIRIYLSFVIMFAIILSVSTMFYSGTRNGIISIGRNPLSQRSIAKGLTQTIIAGLIVFVMGVALVYIVIVL